MKNIPKKRIACLLAADFPHCPLPVLPLPTQPASSRAAIVTGHEHQSGESIRAAGGGRSIMTALIGVRESINDASMIELLRSLRAHDGITSARQSRTNHLLWIEYDPSLTRRHDILAHLGDRGLHACVAGC